MELNETPTAKIFQIPPASQTKPNRYSEMPEDVRDSEIEDTCLYCHGQGTVFGLACKYCRATGKWCLKCCGIGTVLDDNQTAVTCECRKAERIENILRRTVFEEYAACRTGYRGFAPSPNHPKQQQVFEFLADPERKKGAFVYGTTGTGKSHFGWRDYATAVLADRKAVAARLDSLHDETLAFAYYRGDSPPPRPVLLEPDLCGTTRYSIFFDEIDKLKTTENALKWFFNLLDSAKSQNHRLFLTSNEPLAVLESRWNAVSLAYGSPIARRITQTCQVIDLRLATCQSCKQRTHIEKGITACVHCESKELKWL